MTNQNLSEPSGHMVWCSTKWNSLYEAYAYDPADDGPECEVITRILASHPILLGPDYLGVNGAQKSPKAGRCVS